MFPSTFSYLGSLQVLKLNSLPDAQMVFTAMPSVISGLGMLTQRGACSVAPPPRPSPNKHSPQCLPDAMQHGMPHCPPLQSFCAA